MDSLAIKIRKEPAFTAMIVRVIVMVLASYGLQIDESIITPLVLGGWGLVELIGLFAVRSQVVPSVKLINQRTGEAKTKVPTDLKEKLDGTN